MNATERKQLAKEYSETIIPAELTDEDCKEIFVDDYTKDFSGFLDWLSKNYFIVSKAHVYDYRDSKQKQADAPSSDPRDAYEISDAKSQLLAIENIFGREIEHATPLELKVAEYLRMSDVIDNLSHDIFKYLLKYPELHDFEHHATYEGFDISDNETLSIKYYDQGYDVYDSDWFRIPLKNVFDNTWKEYIDNLHYEKVTKIQKEKEESEQKDKEERRLLYERLRAEFED